MLAKLKLSKSESLWQLAIFFTIVYTAVDGPFQYIFFDRPSITQVIIDLIISTIFTVDLIKYFREKKEEKRIKGFHLIVSIFYCIPFDLISFFIPGISLIKLIRLVRLLRIVRMFKIFSLVNSLTILPRFIKLQFIMIWSIIGTHWIACGWLIVGPASSGNVVTLYNKSLYWALTTLTTIGYGDITPDSNISRLYTMVIMILGVGVYGVVIGNVTKMINTADRYKEQSREKINEMTLFMRYYSIPQKLQREVFSYYNHLINKRLSDNDQNIISELPHVIQGELQTYMKIKLISAIPLFRSCSLNCLREISLTLEQIHFSPGETIINRGDDGNEMFIIGHGIVEVIVKDGQVSSTLQTGQHFGEIGLLKNSPRGAIVRAQSYCDVYKLTRESFLPIINKNPKVLNEIRGMILKRSTDRK